MTSDMRPVILEIREAIKAEKKRGDMKDGEFTSSMYADENDLTVAVARHELEDGIALGLVSKRKSLTKANLNYYCKVEKEE